MINWIQRKRNKKGFTLIELIVVIAILGILAAIAIPRFTGMRKEAVIKADASTATSLISAARVIEAETGIEVVGTIVGGDITDAEKTAKKTLHMPSKYMIIENSKFILAKTVGTEKPDGTNVVPAGLYMATWKDADAKDQTVYEGTPFTIKE